MKVAPGAKTVPFGIVMSATNSARSQVEGNTVGVLGARVGVIVGTADSTGVVGEIPGVGDCGVDAFPRTVRLPGINSIAVRT